MRVESSTFVQHKFDSFNSSSSRVNKYLNRFEFEAFELVWFTFNDAFLV